MRQLNNVGKIVKCDSRRLTGRLPDWLKQQAARAAAFLSSAFVTTGDECWTYKTVRMMAGEGTRTRRVWDGLRDTRGVALLEFAMVLPVLLVMLVGMLDFSNAFNIKQKVSNAAREGARLGSTQYKADLGDASLPASIQAIRDDVVKYLSAAAVDTAFIPSTPTSWTPSVAGSGGVATYCSQTIGGTCIGLTIEGYQQIPASGGGAPYYATHVTVTYPYNWTYGFDHIVRLLEPGASYSAEIPISADAIMENAG
jgi:Flp pilus assembly protein TadG